MGVSGEKGAAGLETLLKQGAEALGVELTAEALDGFSLYLEELLKWNRKINLTAITDPGEIVIKHFLDSLALCRALPDGPLRAADIGSGAGFPGLAVKIARPDVSIELIEPAAKKAAFLRQVVRRIGLEGVVVLAEKVEDLGPMREGRYDIIFSRAFRDPARLFPLAAPLLKEGGLVILSLGPSAPQPAPEGWQTVHDEQITLPNANISRRLVSCRKG